MRVAYSQFCASCFLFELLALLRFANSSHNPLHLDSQTYGHFLTNPVGWCRGKSCDKPIARVILFHNCLQTTDR
jgi:hypothetical protein